MRRRLITTILLLAPPAGFTACSRPLPEPAPSAKPQLPDGKGGIYKTGKPYRIAGRWYEPMQYEQVYDESGIASWYGSDFHGKLTANGETYDMHSLSAAHKTIPLPTLMRVTNLENGKSVIVRVNDRGPFVKDRLIDLSYAAAKELDFIKRGTARVRVQSLEQPPASKQENLALAETIRGEDQANTIAVSAPELLTAPATSPSGHLFVQLGAFSSRDNAARLQQLLLADFPTAHTASVDMAGKMIHRVRIGPFNDMVKIERTVVSLQQRGFEKPMVIIE